MLQRPSNYEAGPQKCCQQLANKQKGRGCYLGTHTIGRGWGGVGTRNTRPYIYIYPTKPAIVTYALCKLHSPQMSWGSQFSSRCPFRKHWWPGSWSSDSWHVRGQQFIQIDVYYIYIYYMYNILYIYIYIFIYYIQYIIYNIILHKTYYIYCIYTLYIHTYIYTLYIYTLYIHTLSLSIYIFYICIYLYIYIYIYTYTIYRYILYTYIYTLYMIYIYIFI